MSTSSECSNASTKSGQALEKLKEFGYAFNACKCEEQLDNIKSTLIIITPTPTAGQLRKIDKDTGEVGDEPFQFEVFKDHAKNQAHYENLADVSRVFVGF